MEEKLRKLYASRTKLQKELKIYQELIDEAIDRKDRRVKVERLVNDSKSTFQAAFEKNEDLLKLAAKTENPTDLTRILEEWSEGLIALNDEYLSKARCYINSIGETEEGGSRHSDSQCTTNRSSKHSKSKATSKSQVPVSSSQRRLQQKIARLKREEVERQNAAELRIAQEKAEQERLEAEHHARRTEQQAEQARQQAEQEALETQRRAQQEASLARQKAKHDAELAKRKALLAVFELQEKNRQRLEQAKLDEVAVEDLESSDDEEKADGDLFKGLFDNATNGSERTEAWFNSAGATGAVGLQAGSDVAVAETLNDDALPRPVENVLNANSTSSQGPAAPDQFPKTVDSDNQPDFLEDPQPNVRFHVRNRNQPKPNVASALASSSVAVPKASKKLGELFQNFLKTPASSKNLTTVVTDNALQSQNTQPHYSCSTGGTTYYHKTPYMTPSVFPTYQPSTTAENTCSYAPATSIALGVENTEYHRPVEDLSSPNATLTMNVLAKLLTVSRKDPLPKWKLSTFDGNPLQWHEWYGQFKSAVDQAAITDEVKMTYLKTLVSGKAKIAIEGFAYSGALYRDALKALERKFGQPQAVVTAHLEKLSNYPAVKIHNSESIINYACAISSLIALFQSLKYDADLFSSALLNQAVQKLPPNLKESWSLHTVKKGWLRPSLLDFNFWLQEKTEAYDRMQFGSATKPKGEPNSTTTKVKTATKTFASASESTTPSTGTNELCPVCKGKHPLFRCKVFREKTPNQRAKIVTDNKLCFCFGKGHKARKCSRGRTCGKDNCKLTHNSLLHGADRVFPSKRLEQNSPITTSQQTTQNTSVAKPKAASTAHNSTSSRKTSRTGVKGLLQIVELEVFSPTKAINVFTLCDSRCSHTWISDDLAQKLSLDGKVTSITVNGINCQEVVQTRTVEVNFCSILPDEGGEVFTVNAFTKSSINVGRDFIDVAALKSKYLQLDPVPGTQIDYSSVSMILGQDAYEAIRPVEYFV